MCLELGCALNKVEYLVMFMNACFIDSVNRTVSKAVSFTLSFCNFYSCTLFSFTPNFYYMAPVCGLQCNFIHSYIRN